MSDIIDFTTDLTTFEKYLGSVSLDDDTIIDIVATLVAKNKQDLFNHLWEILLDHQRELVKELIEADGENVDWVHNAITVHTAAHLDTDIEKLISDALGSDSESDDDDDETNFDETISKALEETLKPVNDYSYDGDYSFGY